MVRWHRIVCPAPTRPTSWISSQNLDRPGERHYCAPPRELARAWQNHYARSACRLVVVVVQLGLALKRTHLARRASSVELMLVSNVEV